MVVYRRSSLDACTEHIAISMTTVALRYETIHDKLNELARNCRHRVLIVLFTVRLLLHAQKIADTTQLPRNCHGIRRPRSAPSLMHDMFKTRFLFFQGARAKMISSVGPSELFVKPDLPSCRKVAKHCLEHSVGPKYVTTSTPASKKQERKLLDDCI